MGKVPDGDTVDPSASLDVLLCRRGLCTHTHTHTHTHTQTLAHTHIHTRTYTHTYTHTHTHTDTMHTHTHTHTHIHVYIYSLRLEASVTRATVPFSVRSSMTSDSWLWSTSGWRSKQYGHNPWMHENENDWYEIDQLRVCVVSCVCVCSVCVCACKRCAT